MAYGFEAWLEMIRPINILMTGIGVAVGYFLASRGFPITDNLGLVILSAMVIASAGMIINDYFDRFIDARIKPERPIPSGRVKSWQALILSLVLFGIGVYIASKINGLCFFIAIFSSILLMLYSWMLARIPLIGNSIVALNTGLTFVFGEAAATGNGFSLNISILFTLAFLSTLAREIYKDIEDVEGDKISRKTLPMVVGRVPSQVIASAAIILSIVASPVPFLMGTLNTKYLIGVAIANALFAYIAFASILKGKVYSKELKIAQLIALLAFLAGM